MANKMSAKECAERFEKLSKLQPNTLTQNNGVFYWRAQISEYDQQALDFAAETLKKVESGELVEVVHARWCGIPFDVENDKYGMNKYNMRIKCTNCGLVTSSDFTHAAYCPSCGAKMDADMGKSHNGWKG
jgi:ribosomal protein S27E